MAKKWFQALTLTLALTAVSAQHPTLAGEKPRESRDVELQLAPGDTIKVTTYGLPALSGDFVISSEGTIAFPLVGNIKAAGVKPSAIQETITAGLASGYVTEPSVAVEVGSYRPIYILGEVGKPGEYPYSLGLTIRDAVAKAGGFTYRANEKRVYIKGAGEEDEHPYKLTAGIPVAPGDTIRIGERYF
ncbi:polysaccharide biosynthesis/export family protein [Novosphingobium sp. PP1Y]|uniref:polysaccharide biosynthesis/export family protein n=1 Tax=Novosphingobium sp. PP1Y TaxID=702113 RepID=UPI00020EE91E|nr:polysaccharide biosynthesis/export family protein [Novosphingobium sp. PP1Y]GFM28567.1 periplasmic protein involved in polysaccharide export [Novosphingobium sp. PY1]CCA91716.1 periplasmic protein involved in polysaccharide export [Novosphingobium sp. PP1Y]